MHDAALVSAILGGDVSLFAELVRRHDRTVRRVVARSVADPDSRDELTQQTFYVAFRRLHTLRSPNRLGAWLRRIARNCAADHHRRRPPARELPATLAAPPPAASWIWEEVARLPVHQGEVLRLRYRANCSYAEIAARLKLPLTTVRGRIYEARRALRARLEELR